MKRIALICLPVLALACSDEGDDRPSGTRTDAGITANADAGPMNNDPPSLQLLAEAVCEKQTECCVGNEPVTECTESFERAISPLFTLGGIDIDTTKFNACVNLIANMDCDTAANYGGRVPFGAVCEKFYTGTLANGADCDGASIIERVYSSQRCASGYCDTTSKTCATPPVPPTPNDPGTDCSQDGLCTEGYACFGEPMTCQMPAEIMVGEVCEAGTICELGESQCFCPLGQEGCIRGTCGNRSRCLD